MSWRTGELDLYAREFRALQLKQDLRAAVRNESYREAATFAELLRECQPVAELPTFSECTTCSKDGLFRFTARAECLGASPQPPGFTETCCSIRYRVQFNNPSFRHGPTPGWARQSFRSNRNRDCRSLRIVRRKWVVEDSAGRMIELEANGVFPGQSQPGDATISTDWELEPGTGTVPSPRRGDERFGRGPPRPFLPGVPPQGSQDGRMLAVFPGSTSYEAVCVLLTPEGALAGSFTLQDVSDGYTIELVLPRFRIC